MNQNWNLIDNDWGTYVECNHVSLIKICNPACGRINLRLNRFFCIFNCSFTSVNLYEGESKRYSFYFLSITLKYLQDISFHITFRLSKVFENFTKLFISSEDFLIFKYYHFFITYWISLKQELLLLAAFIRFWKSQQFINSKILWKKHPPHLIHTISILSQCHYYEDTLF